MRRKRLFWQLYPSYLVIAVACLAAVTWYASRAVRDFYLERLAGNLEARALLMEYEVGPRLAAGDMADLDELCAKLARSGSARVTVILPDGRVAGDSREPSAGMENHADRPEIVAALASGRGTSLRDSHTLRETEMYLAVRIAQGDRTLGVLRTAVPLTAVDRALAAVHQRVLVGGLLTALVVAAASLVISRRISRPLVELKRGAERFARGELRHRLSLGETQEFAALAETLNMMAVQLDEKIRAVTEQGHEREAILASMVEGVLAVDRRGRVLWMNRSAARMLGADPQRGVGRLLGELVRNARLDELVGNVLADANPASAEIVLPNQGGLVLEVQVAALGDPRGTGVVVVLHDISRLEKLERVRRDFVANVSHELRTPITSIQGYVETLLDGAMDEPEQLDRFLRIVAAQAERMGAIVEDLLTLARIEADGQQKAIPLGAAAIKPILQAAAEVCHRQARDKAISLAVECDDALEAPVNPALLEQAVVNLVDNAVKYSPDGQTVRIEAAPGDGEIVIRVRDRGCGIGQEHLPRIFERFYRVDKARSRKLGGTGLGLAIVKHIAQIHGGRATVESTLGQGSTFAIHLPTV